MCAAWWNTSCNGCLSHKLQCTSWRLMLLPSQHLADGRAKEIHQATKAIVALLAMNPLHYNRKKKPTVSNSNKSLAGRNQHIGTNLSKQPQIMVNADSKLLNFQCCKITGHDMFLLVTFSASTFSQPWTKPPSCCCRCCSVKRCRAVSHTSPFLGAKRDDALWTLDSGPLVIPRKLLVVSLPNLQRGNHLQLIPSWICCG